MRVLTFLAATILATVPVEAGFGTAVNFPVGTNPRSVAVGDFNGDGKPDLVVVNTGSSNVSILLGTGAGGFGTATTFSTGASPQAVVVGDFNGDGIQDLAVANTGSGVSILIGNGNGTFDPAVAYSAGAGAASLAVGDFNGDGKLDLAVANSGSNTVSILRNSGTGTFLAPLNFAVGNTPRSLVVGDFNRDGRLDVVVANALSNNVSTLLGNGDGTLQAAVNRTVGTDPEALVVGDFDANGIPDLAVANFGSNNVSVLIGNGDGTYSATVNTYAVGTSPAAVAVGSFTADGRQDLVVANSASAGVSVLAGKGDGTFKAAVNYGAGTTPRSVAVADLDGDGQLDLAVANSGSNNVSVLLNDAGSTACTFQPAANYSVGTQPSSVAVGDFNRDGKQDLAVANSATNNVSILLNTNNTSFGTAVNYPAGTGPSSIAVADFDGDGKLDLAVANAGSNNVSILLGDVNGTFKTAVNYGVGTQPLSVAVGDFNRDGKQDLAVANFTTGNVSILRGVGDGTFLAATTVSAASGSNGVAVGDFNRDGKPDLAVANRSSGTISIHIGNGDGTFQTPSTLFTLTAPYSVVVADFNREGRQDLAYANHGSNSISVRLGTGNGTFLTAAGNATAVGPASLAVGDFDGDGNLDLAVANDGSASASILRGNGDGTFQPRVSYNVGTTPVAVAVGDVNGNGRPDLAVANRGSNNVSILTCLPALSIDDVTLTEGNAGTTTATFTVTLDRPLVSPQTVSVSYATANGTATAGSDYVAKSGTLTFTAGIITQPITVSVNGDTLNEANETFFVNLSNPVNSFIADGQGVGTILDDDPVPSISINDVSVPEGNSGTTNANFTVSLSAVSGQAVMVNYATAPGTATAGTDYTAVSGTLTIPAGAPSGTISVPVIGDLIDEDNETFFVNLANPVNATIADGQGLGTIVDDDGPPALSIANCAAVEGDSGTSPCAFHVSLSAPSSRTITVAYATTPDTALAGSDYLTASGTLTFNPGVSTQDAIVSIVGDTASEPNKTYFVDLSTPTNATIGQGHAIGTITDNDDLNFFTLAPCRVLDTGNPPGPSGGPAMSANTTRIFPAAGQCGIPPTAKSIAVNVATAEQTDFGHLRVYPADAALPSASTINFIVGQARGNNAIISLGTAGQIAVSCFMPVGSTGTTRVIVDVFGYFE